LANVGYHITDTTIGNILNAHGIRPAPDRQRTGARQAFVKSEDLAGQITEFLLFYSCIRPRNRYIR